MRRELKEGTVYLPCNRAELYESHEERIERCGRGRRLVQEEAVGIS